MERKWKNFVEFTRAINRSSLTHLLPGVVKLFGQICQPSLCWKHSIWLPCWTQGIMHGMNCEVSYKLSQVRAQRLFSSHHFEFGSILYVVQNHYYDLMSLKMLCWWVPGYLECLSGLRSRVLKCPVIASGSQGNFQCDFSYPLICWINQPAVLKDCFSS